MTLARTDPDNSSLSGLNPGGLPGLRDVAQRYARKALSPNTLRAYEADWACFTTWCEHYGLSSLPATPETVALYLADLAGRKAASTLLRRRATISRAHRRAGFETPTRAAVVEETWMGICRTFGSVKRPKAPVRTAQVRQMVEALDPERLIGVRDRAVLVVGLAGAFRRSELVALDVEDVTDTPDGLEVLLRWSKTDQEGQGQKVGLPWGSDPLTCPVRAWRDWLDASGIPTGPAFRPVTKGGALGLRRLSPAAVASIVKRSAQRVGIDPKALAGHSLRSGMITSAAEADVPERDIMRHSRHRSIAVMRGYIDDATLFKNNAAARIGL